MHRILVLLLFSLGGSQLFAQTDTLTVSLPYDLHIQTFTKYPTLFGVQVENAFAHDRDFNTPTGEEVNIPLNNGQRYNVFATIPVFRTENNWIGRVDLSYDYLRNDYGAVTFQNQQVSDDLSESFTNATVSVGLMKVLPLKRWKKSLLLSAQFGASGKQFWEPQTYQGLLFANIIWKSDRNTTLAFGLTGIIAKHNPIPIFPNISWSQKLNARWNLEMLLPLYAQLRYVQSARSALLGGIRFTPNSPFLNNDITSFQNYDDFLEMSQLDARLFVGGERALNKWFWLNGEVGYNYGLSNKLTESNRPGDEYLLKGNNIGNMYLKVGIFLRPVYKPKK